jgi:hypothetical protein
MFSINQIQEVEEVTIDPKNLDYKEVDIDDSIKIKSTDIFVQENNNPLFNNPKNSPKNDFGKTKIRV